MADYIFTMIRASKFYGAERMVLEDITLAFLPGAKIGVLGPNGAGNRPDQSAAKVLEQI